MKKPCRCTTTGTSTTWSRAGRRDDPAQQGHRPRRSTATAKPAQLQQWETTVSSTTAPRNCTACKPNIDHLVNVLQLRNLYASEQSEHRNLHLRHDRNDNHIVRELQLWNFHRFLHCRNPSTCHCTTTGVSTPSQNCTMEAQID